jgi:hypothetical protein
MGVYDKPIHMWLYLHKLYYVIFLQ